LQKETEKKDPPDGWGGNMGPRGKDAMREEKKKNGSRVGAISEKTFKGMPETGILVQRFKFSSKSTGMWGAEPPQRRRRFFSGDRHPQQRGSKAIDPTMRDKRAARVLDEWGRVKR